MKRLLFFLVVLLLAILIGLQIKTQPGIVLITIGHLVIQTRLWFALLFLLVLFAICYFLLRLLKHAFSISRHWGRWQFRKKTIKATRLTHQGLLAIASGDWPRAQQQLIRAVKNAPVPLFNYLAAAIAATRDGDDKQRDYYLRRAIELTPKAKLAVSLLRAQLQYDRRQYAAALVTLRQLIKMTPKQPQVLRLLAKVYEKLGQWHDLVDLFPKLQKQNTFSSTYFTVVGTKAYSHVFATVHDVKALQQLWKKASQQIFQQAKIIVLYVQALLRLKQDSKAAAVIDKALKHSWNAELVLLFAKVKLGDTSKQLVQAEYWLSAHLDDAQLLFVLAQLAERNQLWGKAKAYYRNSLDNQPDAKVYMAYAKLLEYLGDVEASLVNYRCGLLQATS